MLRLSRRARDEHDDDGGISSHDLGQQLDPGHASQVEVGEDQIETSLGQEFEGDLAARRGLSLVALVLQDVAIDFPLPPFVVDNENGSSGHRRAAVSDIEDEVKSRKLKVESFDF